MTIEAQHFTHYAGDTLFLHVTTKRSDGTLVDLTGSTVEWALSKSPSDQQELFKSSDTGGIVITNPEAGEFEVQIDPEDTETLSGSYHHEADLREANGNETTILVGRITIEPTAV